MTRPVIYTPENYGAITHAKNYLIERGFSFLDSPVDSVTHLLLGTPAFQDDGALKCGRDIAEILSNLPADITVIGGNLSSPALANYHTIDLLKDPFYLAENAYITAHCALRLALWHLPATLMRCPVLVIGWGRIGKCLGQLLRNVGADVTVAARKDTDRAALVSLGYTTINIPDILEALPQYRVIFNTAPELVIPGNAQFRNNCLKIDLASRRGIGGENVIWARGLPGKDAPESSGQLIAQSIERLIYREWYL